MSDPFLIDSPTCISFSGGRTSAYMLWRVLQSNGGLPEEAKVLFCNTGKEMEETLQFVRDCGERWNVSITWLEYRAGPKFEVVSFESASRKGEPFDAVIKQREPSLPNGRSRYCSSELKTRTMHRYLRSLGWDEWDSMVGIRADEPRRVAKFRLNPHPETPVETVCLPLVDIGIGVHDVGAFWKLQAFDLALQTTLDGRAMKGNCDMCMLKAASQVLSLISEPGGMERAVWWANHEHAAAKRCTGDGQFFAINRPSYAQMMKFSKEQRTLFDPNEEAISCFCGD